MRLNTLFAFALALLALNFVSGARYNVTFAEDVYVRGATIELSYEGNECVNVPSNWQNRIKSADIHDHCIRAYTQSNCGGSPTYLHRGYQDYNLLSAFNIEKKIASVKQCGPNVQFELDARPRYGMSIHDDKYWAGHKHNIYVSSGECYTLPKEWQARALSVTLPNFPCWVLYDGTECTGNKRYKTPNSPNHGDLHHFNFDKVIKSAKTCELQFHGDCHGEPCPKYLHNNSKEYAFWNSFFSIYSPRYRNQLEERVKKSTDGLISWDFLFAPSTAASSKGDQYQDAFEILNLILFNMIESPPGKLKFKIGDVEKLENLAKSVLDERIDQTKKYTEDWSERNFSIIKHMEELWRVVDRIFGKLSSVWNAEIEQEYGTIQHEVTFADAVYMRGVNIKLKYKGNECVNVPSNWRNRIMSANINNHCVRVHTQLNCEGSPTYFHRGYQDYYLLNAFNIEKKIASVKQCEPNVQFQLDARPGYGMSVHDEKYWGGNKHNIYVRSGECYTLPKESQARALSVAISNFHCWVLYDGTECTGNKRYMKPGSPNHGDLHDFNFDKVIKSARTCELQFHGECNPAPCPTYLHRSSVEYAFWKFYFSAYSRSYRSLFEERVKKSSDGMISWDFLFAPNKAAASKGDQYSDAFEHIQLVLFNLIEGQPGKLGFNTDSIETLSDLAKTILEERNVQSSRYTEDWTQQNFAVIRQTKQMWEVVDRILGTVSRYWKPEKIDGKQRESELYDALRKSGAQITLKKRTSCVTEVDFGEKYCKYTGITFMDICGLVEPRKSLLESTPLISDGVDAFYGEDPWHAAIYRGAAKTLICGATIISPTVLLSAAHCFFSEPLEMALNDTSNYEIYVAKFTRTYSKRDVGGKFQRIHKIKNLIFSPNGYNPTLTKSYGSDIILIILEEPLKFNKFVRPACIDWDSSIFNDAYDNQNNLGRVVGWGITTNGGIPDNRDASEELLVASLPYVSYTNCGGKVNHITSDKFCGGAGSGPSVQKGDSGGGFMFKFKGRFYLRGIVSTRNDEGDSSVSAFTNVASYTSWIQKFV